MVVTSRSAVLRRAASFLSLLAFELAAVVLLTRLGSVPELRIPWHSLTPWLLNSPVEDVLAAILRNIALLIAWWLLGSNLLYLLARLTRVPGPVAADHPNPETVGPLAYAPNPAGPPREQAPARAASLPGYVPGAAGLLAQQPTQTTSGQPGYVPRPAGNPPPAQPQPTSTSPSSTTGPSSSSTTTPPSTRPPTSTTGYVPSPAGPPSSTAPPKTTTPPRSTAPESTAPPTTAPPRTTAPPGSTAPPRTTAPPGSTAPETRPPTTTTPPTTTAPPGGNQPSPSPQPPEGQPTRSHRVVQGDNLWTISRDHLAAVTNRRSSDLSDHEIATYWLRVIAVNRSSLRSGNPDVIFPDELIMLPPTSGGA